LLSQLIMPSLTLVEGMDEESHESVLIATMTLPAFTPQVDELSFHTTMETWMARHEEGARYLSGSEHK